jgi:hypothetical protein
MQIAARRELQNVPHQTLQIYLMIRSVPQTVHSQREKYGDRSHGNRESTVNYQIRPGQMQWNIRATNEKNNLK